MKSQPHSQSGISNIRYRSSGFQYLALLILALAIAPWVFNSDWVSSSDFHACIEMSSSLIAIIAGIAGIIYFFGMGNTFFLVVGLGFFISGSEDLVHGFFGFKRLWAESGVDFSRFIPGTYVTGRLLLGTMCIIAIITERTITDPVQIKNTAKLLIPLSLLIGGGLTLIAFNLPLPKFVHPERFISRPLDFISAIIFLIAFALGLRRLLKFRDTFTHFLLLSLLINCFGQVYMSFSKQLFDIFFDVAHVANILSYTMPVVGLSIYTLEQLKETKESEREIKAINQKLENYSYTISHDLKEPIRSIHTFSEFIMEDYVDKFDQETKNYFERIIRASSRMAMMIDDLLILSRVGRENIHFEKTDISALLQETIHNMGVDEDQVEITCSDLPVVCCQSTWIAAVFQNLISNSIKYQDEKKESVKISVYCRELSDHYEFSFKDNGLGIEKDQHEKIFGLFRKAHQDKNVEGSGAGLAIVSSVVQEHSGKVWVDWSEPGEGTIMKFTINKYH